MKKIIPVVALSCLVAAVVAAGFSFARDPQWGGHAAVASNGKVVVVGGQSRTLYVLDAESLEVKQRIWVESRIGFLSFNSDGSRLVLEDDANTARIFDTKEWKVVATVKKAGRVNVAPAADLMAAIEEDWEKPKIVFLSMTDGSRKGSAQIPESSVSFALDAEGKKLAVLTYAKEEGEEKKEYSDKPEGLEGLAEKEWVQKNNGETCKLILFEVPTGKKLAEFPSWYTTYSNSTDLVVTANSVLAINFENGCARFDDKGEITMFETANSYNYGRGISADRTAFCTGGLRDGALTVIEGLKATKFDIDEMPGWPEYFEAFSFQADGVVYGVTSAFRIVKLNKEGNVQKVAPVY